MANPTSPRCHDQHNRHTSFGKLRHRKQKIAFCDTEATRLSSTRTLIFGKLTKNTAQRVHVQDTFAHLA